MHLAVRLGGLCPFPVASPPMYLLPWAMSPCRQDPKEANPEVIMRRVQEHAAQAFMQRYVTDLEGIWSTFDYDGNGILDPGEILNLTQYFLQAMQDLLKDMLQEVPFPAQPHFPSSPHIHTPPEHTRARKNSAPSQHFRTAEVSAHTSYAASPQTMEAQKLKPSPSSPSAGHSGGV